MSKEKSKESDFGLEDVFLPIIELINILVYEGIKLLTKGIELVFEKYVFKNKTQKIKKIEKKGLKVAKTTQSFDDIGYSITEKKMIKGEDLDKTKHSVVVGSSGSGKSVLLDTLMFDDMRKGKSVIYLDPKADNESMERFIELCRLNRMDYGIFCEHYHGENKISLNPAKEGSYTHISNRIFKAFTWSEEHYAEKSFQAIKLAVKILKQDGVTVTLLAILEKIKELTKLPKGDPNKLNPDKIDGIITKLSNITDSDFGSILKGKDAQGFSDLRNSGKCIYIGLPVQGYAETAIAIGKLILGDVNHSVYNTYKTITSKNKDSLNPLGLYVDELSSFVTDEFIHILNKSRGAKLEVTSAFQTTSDVNKVDPEMCQQILENSLNWFIMKQRMQKSAEDICNSIGTIESTKDTVRVEDGQNMNVGSQRAVEELIVHPNIIKNLNQGQCVLLRQQPTQIDLMNVKYIDKYTIDSNLNYFETYGYINKVIKPSHANKARPLIIKRSIVRLDE
ncbi:MAG: type IV secretion system DNA-binding domain-containing protein [Halobacteriovoraceae bacterium]|jgi:conjugal transfer pilus assembly protein TraD|nr:type IV secretion system DNA-binding domain-containing protein [Halobacteriovoraceae bacterium]